MRSIVAAVLLLCGSALADDVPLQNWTVPSSSRWHVQSTGDITNATVFVAVTPCRLLDTRLPNGPFGGPQYIAGETRTYDVAAGPCTGLPTAAAAYSMNFTIGNYNVASGSFVTAYPAGTSRPGVSTVNFGTGPPIANAAVVATGSGGQISVYAGGATDILIDINGYFLGSAGTLNAGKTLTLSGDAPNGGIIAAHNASTTSGIYTTGVLGSITSATLTDGSGVMGYAGGGTTWGVKGLSTTNTFGSGGVLGVSNALAAAYNAFNGAGVRGESTTGFGVVGNTRTAWGVAGTFVDAGGSVVRSGYLGGPVWAVYAAGDMAATGTKPFLDPHPTDPTKIIRFVALEGPEAGTYFRGRSRFVRGHATIPVPDAFRFTTEEEGLTVHVTPIGGLAMVAVMRQSLDGIEVESSRDVEFSYIVHGVRRGYRDLQPIIDGQEFMPPNADARMPAYLNESQKQRLIDNGTYRADGTVNIDTALRLGWDKAWKQQ